MTGNALRAARGGLSFGADTLRWGVGWLGSAIQGDIARRRSLAVDQIIRAQNKFARLGAYWRALDLSYRAGAGRLRRYQQAHSLETLQAHAASATRRIDRVLAAHTGEFAHLRPKSRELVWVLSTGRCGTAALHEFLKSSPELLSIHREFKGEQFYEHGSAVTTKSYVFNKVLNDRLSDADVVDITRRYLETRLKTIARAGGRRMVLCQHHDEPWLPFIARVFPDSRFIHLRRDPLPVLQSYLSKNVFSGRQIVPIDVDRGFKLEFSSLFALVCWFYAMSNVYIRLHTELLDPARVTFVKAENFFRGDKAVFERLQAVIGVPLGHEAFVETTRVRHNTKEGGENAFPTPDRWPPGLRKAYAILVEPYRSGMGE